MARPAPAATRAIAILNYLIANPGKAATLSEFSKELDLNIASTHAVLAVLSESGYLVRHPVRRTYAVGPLLVAAGHVAQQEHPAVEHAHDAISALSEEYGCELLVTTAAGGAIVVLARAGPHHPRGLEIGARIPLAPPMGSVFVAWQPDEGATEWMQRGGDMSQRQQQRLRSMLETVRSNGYSIALRQQDFDPARWTLGAESSRPGARNDRGTNRSHGYLLEDIDPSRSYDVQMIAAPVFDAEGQVALALVLAEVPHLMPADEIRLWATRLRDAGLIISRRTRGSVPSMS
jgi:DNA-binding IclR family transcriptional regulator